MRKIIHILSLGIVSLAIAACGGAQDVSNNGVEDDPDVITDPTPEPEPTEVPMPKLYNVRVTLTNIHIYENSEPYGKGELYFTFAVQDTIRYSTRIEASNNSDYNPADFGLLPIDMEVVEGDELYIYMDGYDDDQPNGNDPMGTVNTGWFASESMIGQHSVAAENPYLYDVTYRIDPAN